MLPTDWHYVTERGDDIIFLEDVIVKLDKKSGDDEDLRRYARVSTGAKTGFVGVFPTEEEAEAAYQAYEAKEFGLTNMLLRDRHGSPFEHNSMTFYIEAPIFVFREFMRHRMASYSEESGRYRVLEPRFYVPRSSRPLTQTGKPGAYVFTPGTPEQYQLTLERVKQTYIEAWEAYRDMLDAGVAKEVARVVLPVGIMSHMYVTMNLRSLMNFLSLRTKDDNSLFPSFPQDEIQLVARKMEASFKDSFPHIYRAFSENRRVAP